MERCGWCGTDALYIRYHDEEWGVPVHDDQKQFEFLVLESAQAGLSWLTVLRKRAHYRTVYDGFDPETVARYDADKVERLLADPGIIRNRRKIESSIRNARAFLKIQQEFGSFDAYIWGFVGGKPLLHHYKSTAELPATSPLAETISKDLKRRGFSFLGPTIVYSHLQATGLVNDHIDSCFCKNRCAR